MVTTVRIMIILQSGNKACINGSNSIQCVMECFLSAAPLLPD